MRRYIPDEIAAKLEAARGRGVEGERRVVTILFCDVQGSTAMAEELDPEEWTEIMNEVFAHLIEPIYRYEGVVARLMGDAILAFFGAPIAHEDDPQRAVLAALEVVERTRPFRERLKRERGFDFDVRVGINTGLVVVGEVGSDLRVEYTAMGDAVNLAARMEQTAKPGTVQVTEETYRLVAPLFDVEDLGGIEVKGKREPVRAYRILGGKAAPGPLRGIAGRAAPLVGRARELATLRRAVDDVLAGRGRVVALVGEAGLGKSRLIAEARAAWRGHWLESHGVSYEAGRPYGQLRQQVSQLCGVAEPDAPEVACAKIERSVAAAVGAADPRAAAVLSLLLGVGEAGAELPEGEALRRAVVEALASLLRAASARDPLVACFDDLHWSDAASAEVLGELLPLAHEARLLFICASRPDPDVPAAALRERAARELADRYEEIALVPLAEGDASELVAKLLPETEPDLRRQVIARAEGNPFFVEEVARTLLERDGEKEAAGPGEALPPGRSSVEKEAARPGEALPPGRPSGERGEAAIPESLQGLLTARVDRLPEAARRALQVASVIGRSFEADLLARVADVPATQLAEQLATLERAALVEPAGGAFAFRHALTQDAVYQGVLLRRRRELHRRVGETLEALDPERVADLAPLLAHHYDAANDPRAQRHYVVAGDRAYRLYANVEAASHYARAVALARRGEKEAARPGEALPPGRPSFEATRDTLLHLYTRRGRALELSDRLEDAVANYEELAAVARERSDASLELAALNALATLRSVLNRVHDAAQAQALSERALVIARGLGDRAAEAKILWNLMLLHSMAHRDAARAARYGEESLAIAWELGLREQAAFTLNDLYHVRMVAADLRGARAALEESRPLWEALENKPMLADNLASAAYVSYLEGEFDQALVLSDAAYEIAVAIKNLWGQAYSRRIVGHIHLERGDPERAIAEMERVVRLGEEAGLTPTRVISASDLGWTYATLGDLDRALALTASACDHARNMPRFRPIAFATRARVLTAAGDLEAARRALAEARAAFDPNDLAGPAALVPLADAEFALASGDGAAALAAADEAVAWCERMAVRAFRANAHALRGRALRALGRGEEARQALVEARDEAEARGSVRLLWAVLLDLAELTDDVAEAADLRTRAQTIVERIAEGTAGDLRALFLASVARARSRSTTM